MSNITVLPGAPTPKNAPVNETVDMLKQALAKAEKGEIRSCAIACILPNGDVLTNWVCDEKPFSMIGAVEYLKTRLLKDLPAGKKN